MTDYVVAGTGTRQLVIAPAHERLAALNLVDTHLFTLQQTHGAALVVMSGMAEGFDELLARRAIAHGIPLWCAVPNRGYGAYYWGRESLTKRNRTGEFNRILTSGWRVTYVMEDVHRTRGLYLNGVHSNFVRNTFMAETARELLAWDSGSSGTAHCVSEAARLGKPCRDISQEMAA